MIKCHYDVEKAVRITVELEGDVERYAMSFLHIWNNVREYYYLYKMENSYNNDVIITCDPDCLEEAKEYLAQFGTVKDVEEIKWYTFYPAYEYDELFDGDMDAEYRIVVE